MRTPRTLLGWLLVATVVLLPLSLWNLNRVAGRFSSCRAAGRSIERCLLGEAK